MEQSSCDVLTSFSDSRQGSVTIQKPSIVSPCDDSPEKNRVHGGAIVGELQSSFQKIIKFIVTYRYVLIAGSGS